MKSIPSPLRVSFGIPSCDSDVPKLRRFAPAAACVAAALALFVTSPLVHGQTVTVPGTANPWLAGHPAGTTAQQGDSAPTQSPVLAAQVVPGEVLRFTVTGNVNYYPVSSNLTPDGGATLSHLAENGIAPFAAPISSLIGVFLSDSAPAGPAPGAFSHQPDNLLVSPGLHQPFFIGNGLGAGGAAQRFVTPAGATRLFLGSMDGYEWKNNDGFFIVTIHSENVPEIVVAQTDPLVNNDDAVAFGLTAVGGATTLTFTISNSGNAVLSNLSASVSGNPASFKAGPLSATSVPAGGAAATFEVTFNPGSEGFFKNVLRIYSNDPDESPFVFDLTGTAISATADSDGDGLGDLAERRMEILGFDWQVAQSALVAALNQGANDAGFYTTSQVQALHVGTPLLRRNPANGEFTLTVRVKKSTDLVDFDPFPMSAPQVTINGAGELEFRFTPLDDAAFFRLEVE